MPHAEREVYIRGHLCDYLPPRSWTVLVELGDLEEAGKHYLERTADITGLFSVPGVFKQLVSFPSVRLSSMPIASMETTYQIRAESVERFSGDVTKVRDELDKAAANDIVLIACHNDAEKKRLMEKYQDDLKKATMRMLTASMKGSGAGMEALMKGMGAGGPMPTE